MAVITPKSGVNTRTGVYLALRALGLSLYKDERGFYGRLRGDRAQHRFEGSLADVLAAGTALANQAISPHPPVEVARAMTLEESDADQSGPQPPWPGLSALEPHEPAELISAEDEAAEEAADERRKRLKREADARYRAKKAETAASRAA